MSTTTIRIEDALKARIAAAAERAGKSSHAFILDTLAETVERSELDEELHLLAEERWASLMQTRETVSWPDAKAFSRLGLKGRIRAARGRASRQTDTVAHIDLASTILEDIDRFVEHTVQHQAADIPQWVDEIIQAIPLSSTLTCGNMPHKMLGMAQSIRISNELYSLAQAAGKALHRPIAQQMEHWTRLGVLQASVPLPPCNCWTLRARLTNLSPSL